MPEQHIFNIGSGSTGNGGGYQRSDANAGSRLGDVLVERRTHGSGHASVHITVRGLDDVIQNLRLIDQRLARIEEILAQFTEDFRSSVREISDEEAREDVKAYYEQHHGEAVYPDQVADDLALDVMQVIRVCEQLLKEGRLGSGHP